MPFRSSHGAARGRGPRIETSAPGELPAGLPAAARVPPPPLPEGTRNAAGQVLAGTDGVRELARRGGLAKAAKDRARVRVLECLGLVDLPADTAIHPYLIQAEEFAQHEVARLAREVGGGETPANAASIVQSSALQLASSRFLFATAEGDAAKLTAASRLADASKQGLAMAHELTARTALARAKHGTGETPRERLEREARALRGES